MLRFSLTLLCIASMIILLEINDTNETVMRPQTSPEAVQPMHPNNFLSDFCIAGFKYYDGLEVFDQLSIGVELDLELEEHNYYDPNAIKILLGDKHLGYIPSEKNELVAKLLRAGYKEIFSLRINRVCPDKHTDGQIHCTLKIISRDQIPSMNASTRKPKVDSAKTAEPKTKRKYTRRTPQPKAQPVVEAAPEAQPE